MKSQEVFPNSKSWVIFVVYVALFVGQGIFITASRSKQKNYDYNTVTVVLLTEVVKLILAFVCYIKDHSLPSLVENVRSNVRVLCLYLVPSFLYCIYNNLAFVNLWHFDPTTYFILLQLRVVITGIVFQFVFHKKLSKMQWFSLVLLTSGCMVQQINWTYVANLFSGLKNEDTKFFALSFYLILILVQTLCSCFAGVYNEYLLKGDGAQVNIFIQNIFMYLDSIFWNLIVIFYQGNLMATFTVESFTSIWKPLVIIIIFNNALIGITTSLFLKNLNSILKTFASAMELLFTAILSWLLFGIDIRLNTILAIAIVSYSMYLYSQNPVDNRPKPASSEDQRQLLENV